MIDWITNKFQHRKLRKEGEKQAAAVDRRKRDVHCVSAHLDCEDCRYFHQSAIGD